MFIKKAITLTEPQTLNVPIFDGNWSYLKSDPSIFSEKILKDTLSTIKTASQKLSSLHTDGDNTDGDNTEFDLKAEINEHPSSLYVKCFAIKADEINDNGDNFDKLELKKAVSTFVGVPVFVNHNNTNAEEARGKVVHSWWDEEKNGIMVIKRVDAEAYPQLGRGIKESYISSTSMGCFTPECRVLMEDGIYRPISDIQPGDKVITHTGKSQEVLNVQIRSKNEDLREIRYEGIGTSLIATKNHPVLTLRKFDKCACGCGKSLPKNNPNSHREKNWKNKYRSRFINGHSQNIWNSNTNSHSHTPVNKIAIRSCRSYSQNDFEWIEVKEIKSGDVVVFPVTYKKTQRDQPTLDQAKLIGYFLSEGSFKKYKGIRKEVNFSFCYLSEKNTYVPEVIELLRKCFGTDISIWTQNYQSRGVISVCCHNKKVADWFYKYCGEYSTEKRLPTEFIQWSEEVQKTIIGYFINGDGCTSTRKYKSKYTNKISLYTNISINTSSQKLADQFHTSLSRCSIWHTFHASYNHKATELKMCAGLERWTEIRCVKGKELTFNCLPAFSIQINQNYATEIYPFTRKNDKILYKKTKTFAENNDLLITGPYLCRKVKSSDIFMYNGPVYNLQVKGDNSYIVEGAVVKNCQVKYSLCSVCHNLAEAPDSYCSHIKERKTRQITAKKVKCEYHKNGHDEKCPLCGSTKKDVKVYDYEGKSFEHNYGIKFIESSFVVNPACHDCGVTEIIDPQEFIKKVSFISSKLPALLKAAASQNIMCTNTSCIKLAGQKEIDQLNQALDLMTRVAQSMLKQKDQLDLEFLSDLVEVVASLQTVTDELMQQGYGRLQSPPETPGEEPAPSTTPPSTSSSTGQNTGVPGLQPMKPTPGGGSKIQTGPAGETGTITTPMAGKQINIYKLGQFLKNKRNFLTNSIILNKKKNLQIDPKTFEKIS